MKAPACERRGGGGSSPLPFSRFLTVKSVMKSDLGRRRESSKRAWPMYAGRRTQGGLFCLLSSSMTDCLSPSLRHWNGTDGASGRGSPAPPPPSLISFPTSSSDGGPETRSDQGNKKKKWEKKEDGEKGARARKQISAALITATSAAS